MVELHRKIRSMNRIGLRADNRLSNHTQTMIDDWRYSLLKYVEDGVALVQGMRHLGTKHFRAAVCYRRV